MTVGVTEFMKVLVLLTNGLTFILCEDCTEPSSTSCPCGYRNFSCGEGCTTWCNGPHCKSSQGSITCPFGCMDGFAGKACNIPCFHRCDRCRQERREECLRCKNNRFGIKCQKYCPVGCGLQGCLNDGACKNDCNHTHICGNRCLQKCLRCKNSKCESCKLDFGGDFCEIDCRNCVDGNCTYSGCSQCKPGYWGINCNSPCDDKCEVCAKTSGECLKCGGGYFGIDCAESCSRCQDDLCDTVTGKCFRCIIGFHGQYCNITCRNCSLSVCSRLDGNCILQSTTLSGVILSTAANTNKMTFSSPLVLGLIALGSLSFLTIACLIYRLCKKPSSPLQETSIEMQNVYHSYTYEEIKEDDMDPSLEPSKNISPPQTDDRNNQRSPHHASDSSTGNNPTVKCGQLEGSLGEAYLVSDEDRDYYLTVYERNTGITRSLNMTEKDDV